MAAERPDRVLKAGSSRATAVLVWLCCGIVAGYLLLVQDIESFLRFGPFVALTVGAPVPRNAIAAGIDVSRGRQIQVPTPTNGDGGGAVVSTWNLATIAVGILAVIWVVVSLTL